MREDMGADVYLHFTVDAPPAVTEETKDLASDRGDDVLEELKDRATSGRSPFIARVGPESTVSTAERAEIAVDTRKLHFFDPETGEAIAGGSSARRVAAGSSSLA
jgi:multiple sugar transport system ATP-binding protein